jgi:hypothetical protein
MREAARGDDSITVEEIIALEESACERVNQYMAKSQQNWETRVGELLAEVSAGSDVKYNIVDSKHGKDAEFCKVDNTIYYILSEKENIGSQEEKSIACNFSDLPFPMFIAYLVYSSLTSELLNDPFTYVEGRLTPEEYSSFSSSWYGWEKAFCFLLHPRLQNYCFKVLESNNVSKHNLLMMWTIFLKYYCQENNFGVLLGFDSYEPDRTARTATMFLLKQNQSYALLSVAEHACMHALLFKAQHKNKTHGFCNDRN